MRIENTSLPFSRPGLDYVIALYNKNRNNFYTQFTVAEANTKPFIRVATEGDFQAASEVGQGEPIDFQDWQTPFYRDYTFRKRALGYTEASETSLSDLYGAYSRKMPKMLKSIDRAMEFDAAEFLNLATSTTVPTPDGLALASAAHLLDVGTYSNILSGNPPLSVTSLAQAKTEIFKQVSHTGEPMAYDGDLVLLVHPDRQDLAYRLINADKQPTTGDNDPNWAGQKVKLVVNPYFSSTTAWALVAADKASNPLKMVTRRGVLRKEDYDINRDAYVFTATCIWLKAAMDWRGFVYSAGA